MTCLSFFREREREREFFLLELYDVLIFIHIFFMVLLRHLKKKIMRLLSFYLIYIDLSHRRKRRKSKFPGTTQLSAGLETCVARIMPSVSNGGVRQHRLDIVNTLSKLLNGIISIQIFYNKVALQNHINLFEFSIFY